MLGDPVLWQAFYQAKDGLISALREAPLVYQAPSGLRVWKDTGSILASITEAVHEIETVQSELSSLRSYLIRSHVIITNRHSLPRMLPIELLQEIISLVVPYPDDYHTTLKLSQVSKQFRDAVLGISRLFTEPDWIDWPVPLLELWCQRARTNPLKICVYDSVLHSVGEARKRALLESCSSQWGYLHIVMHSPREKNEIIVTGISNLLRCSAPSLHTLVLYDDRPYDSTGTQFALDCAPSFHKLILYGICPLLPASHTSVTSLTCECLTSRDWLRCQDVIRSCRLLQRLALGFGFDYVDVTTYPNMRATLTSVVHLGLRHVGEESMAAINQFLAYFDMPNLNSLRLVSLSDLNLETHGDFYESLGHGFSGIRILSVNTSAGCRGAKLQVLNCLRRRPMKFPHLKKLHLLDDTMDAEIAQVIQDVLLLRKGTITHLTTRMPQDVTMLRDHVAHLKLY